MQLLTSCKGSLATTLEGFAKKGSKLDSALRNLVQIMKGGSDYLTMGFENTGRGVKWGGGSGSINIDR